MCNQWGEKGYFFEGIRPVQHMDEQGLTTLMRGLSPKDSLISVHGGEPFAYKHLDTLLDLLAEKPFDVMFTTNGTLLKRSLERLAKIKNLGFLLSIDGDEETHDKIRGEGCFKRIKEGLAALFDERRRQGLPLPFVVMSSVVCEWNSEVLDTAYDVARDLGVMAINFNMRWFLNEDIGQAYEKHLKDHFGLTSTGAWRGWISNQADHDYTTAAQTLQRLVHKKRMRPPFVVTTPSHLRGDDYKTYFADYLDVFGNESCFMPFYWARIHATGELIYCPGHPDIVVGNVFEDGFLEAFNSEKSIQFRKHILGHRFPICNRCCGLYMTNPARPHEQKARKRLGLGKEVAVHWP